MIDSLNKIHCPINMLNLRRHIIWLCYTSASLLEFHPSGAELFGKTRSLLFGDLQFHKVSTARNSVQCWHLCQQLTNIPKDSFKNSWRKLKYRNINKPMFSTFHTVLFVFFTKNTRFFFLNWYFFPDTQPSSHLETDSPNFSKFKRRIVG